MKRSASTLAALLAAMLFSVRTPSARTQTPSAMPHHSLSVVGNWGADLSPDGHTVAVSTLRRYPPPGASLAEEFVSVEAWDFRTNRRLTQRLLTHRPIYTPLTSEWGQVRYTGDGNTLLVYDGELLHVLEAATLEEITRIDLGLPALPRADSVTDLAAPQSITGQAAMWFSRGGGHGGSVRVYDLRKGNLVRRWNFDRGYPEFGSHVAWSPNGKQLAVTVLPVTPGGALAPYETTLKILRCGQRSRAARYSDRVPTRWALLCGRESRRHHHSGNALEGSVQGSNDPVLGRQYGQDDRGHRNGAGWDSWESRCFRQCPAHCGVYRP